MDMLISLSQVPADNPQSKPADHHAVTIRRGMSFERRLVINWVLDNFSTGWADECAVAFGRQPIGCYIAVDSGKICGFCCLESTFLNFIGPIGVAESMRAKGVGRLLLLRGLQEMRTKGYAYAFAGHVGTPEFFERVAAAIPVPDQIQDAYPDPLG